jgi:hypothetical protein
MVVENTDEDRVIVYAPFCHKCTKPMPFVKGAALKPQQVNATDTFSDLGYIAELAFMCAIHPAEGCRANQAQIDMINKYPISKQVLRVLDLNKHNKKIKKYGGDRKVEVSEVK